MKIAAVIVKYGEYTPVILNNLDALLKLDVFVILVDNSLLLDPPCNRLNIKYIHNQNNNGLAGGLNAGIKYAINNGAYYLFLLDQDTILNLESLKNYLVESTSLLEDKSIACCGPSFIDMKDGKRHGFANYGFLKIKAKPSDELSVSCLYLMTSATMIKKEVFDMVGLMDETLFIDYIDIEWCLRAISMGYKVVGLSKFKFLHNVGDSVRNIFWFKVPVHSKTRLYYQTRNFVYLLKRSYVPIYWKFCEMFHAIKRTCFYCIIDKYNMKIILKGLHDGIKN